MATATMTRHPLPRLRTIRAARERAAWREVEAAWRAELDARLRLWLIGELLPLRALARERGWRP